MTDVGDFIYKERLSNGKIRKCKLYRTFCDICGKDKGYQGLNYLHKTCNKCNRKGILKVISNETKDKYKNVNFDKRKIIRGVSYFETICPKCNIEKRFRRNNFDKLCNKCNKMGIKKNKPSWNKGLKLYRDPWNKGLKYGKVDAYHKKIRHNMSSALSIRLKKRKIIKDHSTFDILGYTTEQLKIHLESLFKPGMTWDNYGEWHIDHIVPDSYFNYKTIYDNEFKMCWSLHNLQPLWAKENLSKHDKINNHDIIELKKKMENDNASI